MKRERLIINKLIKIFVVCLFYWICCINIIVKADSLNVYFDYISYYQENNVNEIDSFGNNVLNPVVKVNSKKTTEISLMIKDELNKSQNIFYNGDFTNAREIEIIIKSEFKSFYLEIFDSNNETIKVSSSSVIKINNLPNGEYYFVGKCYGESYQNNNVYVGYYTVCKLRFNVDCSPPTISGASTNKNNYIDSTSVNVKTNDAGCGVEGLYMKKPTDTQFSKVGASIFLTDFEDGLYEFYAKDKIGNISNKYYLRYDSLGPIGYFVNDNESITDEYTNMPFKFISIDNGSGVEYAEYMMPNSKVWLKYEGENIEELVEGTYQFRSFDICGNISDIYYIKVDKTKPKILLYGDDILIENKTNVSCKNIYFDVLEEGSEIKDIFVKLPNSNIFVNYEIGKKYNLNGNYTLYAYDNAGNRSDTFSVFLDNEPPLISATPDKLNAITSEQVEIKCVDLSECMLYYKSPSMSSFLPCDNLFYILNDSKVDGKYYFYADDILGNKSEIYWILKKDNVPNIDIVRDNENNTVYINWENDNYLVTVNGKEYLKKSIISEENIYEVIVTENGTNEYKTDFVIDHLYKLIENKQASCEEPGYKRYRCITCGDTYDNDIVEPLKHSFKEIFRQPTCLEEGMNRKICINCDYEEVKIIPKNKHQYILIDERIVDKIKEKEYECVVCKERYIEREKNVWDKITDFVDYLLDNYFEKIIWILLSLTGIWSIVLGVKIIIAKKEDDREKAIRYLRTYLISLVLIFIIFLICPILIRGFIYLIS